ncbi:neurogenic locus notch homolog protein 1-like [Actinia tenebrosa]|uniref:Neurogenic locus notch homolog protein 1-like n=1 Tax=Actinia tenebrosa TaxID=6105 RepID=A0A6P8IF13_ACTTE|nr:neurogenic locus notch homolog protein 1-like [Actinia tenebrosa]
MMENHILALLVLTIASASRSMAGPCPQETECFGHGDWDPATQTCKCYSDNYQKQWESRYGSYTGDCCTSIKCTNANSTCLHGICGADGRTCQRCQTGWIGQNCDKPTNDSCYPWLPCKHGKCVTARFKCECDPGWVGDLCDRSLCDSSIKCVFGACPDDPKICKCYEDFMSPATGCDRMICADGWTCLNGGYCVDVHHCVCPPYYTGEHCETIAGCSVPCEHGRCTTNPAVCECETNWIGANCSKYVGPCNNCSSVGGTCYEGPDTCECKPGYTGPQCSVMKCDGCVHGLCQISGGKKHCICDKGWLNTPGDSSFDGHGPCTVVQYCIVPCVQGSCPNDPYRCVCRAPYVGAECDAIRCPKCCPPETCDCSNPAKIQCRERWHHSCCLIKSCFRGDTLVHTARGLVPIREVRKGDMVVTRHEGDDPSATYLRKVDAVVQKNVSLHEMVVLRTHGEDIWTTYNHPFFSQNENKWIAAENISTKHTLHAIKGSSTKLKEKLPALQLMSLSSSDKIPVYDLVIHEYDRYAVGKDGLLVSSCNDTDLLTRDRQMWGDNAHPLFSNFKNEVRENKAQESGAFNTESASKGMTPGLVAGIVVGVFVVIAVVILVVTKVSKRRQYSNIDNEYVTEETHITS